MGRSATRSGSLTGSYERLLVQACIKRENALGGVNDEAFYGVVHCHELGFAVEEEPRRIVMDDLERLGVELFALGRVGGGTRLVEQRVNLFTAVEGAVGAGGHVLAGVEEGEQAVVGVTGDGAPAHEAHGHGVLFGRTVGLIEVGRPFEGFDLGVDAYLGQHALDCLGNLDVLEVAAAGAVEGGREAVLEAGGGKQLTGALRVVLVLTDRGVAEDAGRDGGVAGTYCSACHEVSNVLVVDRVVDGLAYALIGERLDVVVEVDVDRAHAGDVLDGDVVERVEPLDVLRRDTDGHVGLTALDHRHAGGVLRHGQEAHAGEFRSAAPVVVVAFEVD